MSPLGVLARGYAVVRDATTGAVIKSVVAVQAEQTVDVLLADGVLTASVTSVAMAGGALDRMQIGAGHGE